MLDAAPGKVGNVKQAVDAAEINESAVVGDVLHDALDHRALLQAREQRLTLGTLRGFEHGAARHHDVIAFTVELDNLEIHHLVFVRRSVFHRPNVDE